MLAQRELEHQDLQALERRIQLVLDQKNDEIKLHKLVRRRRPVVLDKPDAVRLVPDEGIVTKKKPIVVEVRFDGYLVHPDETLLPLVEVKKRGKEDHYIAPPKLKKFTDQVHHKRDAQYLLLLVHPNGTKAYWNLRGYLRQEYPKPSEGGITTSRIDVGVEPFLRGEQYTQPNIE